MWIFFPGTCPSKYLVSNFSLRNLISFFKNICSTAYYPVLRRICAVEKKNRAKKENRYGIRGWLNPTRFGIERVSFIFMRISGIFCYFFFLND